MGRSARVRKTVFVVWHIVLRKIAKSIDGGAPRFGTILASIHEWHGLRDLYTRAGGRASINA